MNVFLQKAARLQLAYSIVLCLAALWLAWLLAARCNFFYGVWYEVLDINATITEYGPKNRNRSGFERTDKAEHERLFAALVAAIHSKGQGLETLTYRDPAGRKLGLFLTPPEIVHLRDVAALIDTLRWPAWVAVLGWLVLTVRKVRKKQKQPSLLRVLSSLSLLLSAAGLIVLLIGPVKVFYQLHVWIFPPGHPWFFYYQDSLMTTLLQAPNIFGPIVLSWLVLSLGMVALLLAFTRVFTSDRRWIARLADQPRTKRADHRDTNKHSGSRD